MNIDWSKLKTAEQIQTEALAAKQQHIRLEATRRIEARWDKVGQANVALGLYPAEQAQACRDWINAHRATVEALSARTDLIELDIQSDGHWPQ